MKSDNEKTSVHRYGVAGNMLKEAIKTLCKERDLYNLSQRMGYSNVEKGADRIRRVVQDNSLGLVEGEWDGVYSSEQFLKKLVNLLDPDLDKTAYMHEIEKLKRDAYTANFGYRPWIFVDTQFVRNSEPIFALAFAEHLRRIKIGHEIIGLDGDEALAVIRGAVLNHFDQLKEHADGHRYLPVWGRVHRYCCHISEDTTIILSTAGDLIERLSMDVPHSRATLSV